MVYRAALALVIVSLVGSVASAKDVLRVKNESDSTAYIVVQEQTAPGAFRRWVTTIQSGDSASLRLGSAEPDRVVIAYLFEDGKFKQIMAVTTVTKDDFYFTGDALVFLMGTKGSYKFEIPKVSPIKPPPAKPVKPVKAPELTEDQFKTLIEQSDKKTFTEDKDKNK
jgi:hypothetical protein